MVISNVESNEYYDAGVEVFEGTAYLHCTVHRYTPSVKKRLVKLIEIIKIACKDQNIKGPYGFLEDCKFAEKVGGVFIKNVNLEGKTMGVFVWD